MTGLDRVAEGHLPHLLPGLQRTHRSWIWIHRNLTEISKILGEWPWYRLDTQLCLITIAVHTMVWTLNVQSPSKKPSPLISSAQDSLTMAVRIRWPILGCRVKVCICVSFALFYCLFRPFEAQEWKSNHCILHAKHRKSPGDVKPLVSNKICKTFAKRLRI